MKNEEADAGRDGRTRLARPNSQARTGTGIFFFLLLKADHEQDCQLYSVDPYFAVCDDHTYSLRDIPIWTIAARVALLSSPVNSTNGGSRTIKLP